MTEIKNQILEEIGDLQMKTVPIEKPVFYKRSLKRFLNSKEVLHVSQENKDEILSWSPSVLLPDYEVFYNSLEDDVKPENDYSGMTDGYNVSEFFAASRRYRVTADYLRYIKSTKDGYIINIYGGENTLASNIQEGGHCGKGSGNIWKYTANPEGRAKYGRGDIPNYEFTSPESVVYSEVKKTKYWDKMLISSCRNPIAVLLINLPQKYFSNQILVGNIFTWDIGAEKYQVAGLDVDEVNKRIEKLAANGFDEPLVMRINEGCLTPVDDDTAVNLFLATYLNLPTIPAALYMSDEDVAKNEVVEELHDIVHSSLWHDGQALTYVNDVCKPYFYFETAEQADKEPFLMIGGKPAARSQYLTMNDIDDPNLTVFDRYLDKDAPEEQVLIPMTEEELNMDLSEMHRQILEAEDEKWQEEIEETNRKILAGEY